MSDDQIFRLIALVAVLLLLVPAAFKMSPAARQTSLKAGAAFIGLGIVLALGYWLVGG